MAARCPRFSQDRVNFHQKPGGDTADWASRTQDTRSCSVSFWCLVTWNAFMLSYCGICHPVLHFSGLNFSEFRNSSILNKVFFCQSSLNSNIKLPCICTERQPAEYLQSSSAAPSFPHPDDVCTDLTYWKLKWCNIKAKIKKSNAEVNVQTNGFHYLKCIFMAFPVFIESRDPPKNIKSHLNV